MSKTIIKAQIFSLLLILALAGPAWAWPPLEINKKADTKLSKRITRGFKTSGLTKLEVNNKYGEVIVDTWQKDSIRVEITLTTYGKNESAAEKLMDRVDIDSRQVDDFVSVESTFDRSKGFFNDLWNSVGDYSKTILNKSKMKIDYRIYMPINTSLDLTNKFGDVFLPDLMGKVTLDLGNGALKADRLTGQVAIYISFGEARIKSVDEAKVTLKSAELELKSANQLELRSSSSEININDLRSLRIDSRTDKINIAELSTLQGNGSFTKIRLDHIGHSIDVDMNYGFLDVFEVPADFSNINVVGNSTDVSLTFEQGSHATLDVTTKVDKLDLPKQVSNIKQRYTDGREKFVTTTGYLGKLNNNPSDVTINAQGGEVTLNIFKNEIDDDQSSKRYK